MSALSEIVGSQVPRIMLVPEFVSSTYDEALELLAMAGVDLDEAQRLVLYGALGEKEDHTWAALEVGVVEGRQNGKNEILMARQLVGLFLGHEKLSIHSAHLFSTSLEHFRRLLEVIEDTPDFDRRVKRVSKSHGEEGIELKSGERIQFRTRTGGGGRSGRGFTCDVLYFDECMYLSETAVGAIIPSAAVKSKKRPSKQIWYSGSAVDQTVQADGIVLARLRERALAGAKGLAYYEWSVDRKNPDDVDPTTAADPHAWAQANPALGTRIPLSWVESERGILGPREFAVERLGVGDWPRTDGKGEQVITLEQWLDLADEKSKIDGSLCFAFDVSPDRSWASIAAAGRRADGNFHVEILDRRRGTGWVVKQVAKFLESQENVDVICDASGPAGSLLHEFEQEGIEITTVTAREHGQACGIFFDAVDQKTIRHLATPDLSQAINGATKRPLGEAWAWSRKSSTFDISPLVSSTLALWGFTANVEVTPWYFTEEAA